MVNEEEEDEGEDVVEEVKGEKGRRRKRKEEKRRKHTCEWQVAGDNRPVDDSLLKRNMKGSHLRRSGLANVSSNVCF